MHLLKKYYKKIFILLLIFCIFYLIYTYSKKTILNYKEEEQIDLYFKQYNNNGNEIKMDKENYNMIIEIPKIKLKKGIYDITDIRNNINENITVLYSEINNNQLNLVLAAHSGNNYNAYFKDLYKLNQNDKITIYYQNNKYEYNANNIYTKSKTNNVYLLDNNKEKLVLITCKDNHNYLIIEASQIHR